jgi:hypothetical protein
MFIEAALSMTAAKLSATLIQKNRNFLQAVGTPFRPAHYRYVTAETPPPVQAAGDTIPKGLRSNERRPFFFTELFRGPYQIKP